MGCHTDTLLLWTGNAQCTALRTAAPHSEPAFLRAGAGPGAGSAHANQKACAPGGGGLLPAQEALSARARPDGENVFLLTADRHAGDLRPGRAARLDTQRMARRSENQHLQPRLAALVADRAGKESVTNESCRAGPRRRP